jgi:hypothetical protein
MFSVNNYQWNIYINRYIKTYLGLEMHCISSPCVVVVVLAVSWRCGREESSSCGASGSMKERNEVDVCFFVCG